MGTVKKINFPYFLKLGYQDRPINERIVVFFGTDFYNLPIDSNRQAFIEKTNEMLRYIEKHFPGRCLLYQAHPNEKDEFDHLQLGHFQVGARDTVAELFLYDNANLVEYVFSACSGASISAFAMGFHSAIFLEALTGALSAETIIGYRSYFYGLPEAFSFRSFEIAPPAQPAELVYADSASFEQIQASVGKAKTVWFLGNEPGTLIKAIILAQKFRQSSPELHISLIRMPARRWSVVESRHGLFSVFDKVVDLVHPTVRYSARPKKIWAAIKSAKALRELPIAPEDAIISFATTLFEENVIMSAQPKAKKIMFIGAGWYHFIYEDGYRELPESGFRTSRGVRFFSHILEPFLGLWRTTYQEYRDGKVINFFRYRASLEQVYDAVFVLSPGTFAVGERLATRELTNRWLDKFHRFFARIRVRRQVLRQFKNNPKRRPMTRAELVALLGAPALLHDSEVLALMKYASETRGDLVEIGAAYGASALLFLLSKKPAARLFSVDPFIKDSMASFQASPSGCRRQVARALNHVGLGGRLASWELKVDYSFNVVKQFKDSIGLVFIDGDHNYEAVKRDFIDWLPFVDRGGFILFHDSCQPLGSDISKYERGWPGPSQLVRELRHDSRVELVAQVHSLSIFRKN